MDAAAIITKMSLKDDVHEKLVKIQNKYKYERDAILEMAIDRLYDELCKEESVEQLKVDVAYLFDKFESLQSDIAKISKCCQTLQVRVNDLENGSGG